MDIFAQIQSQEIVDKANVEFENLKRDHDAAEAMTGVKYSSMENVLQLMLDNKKKIWWFAWEFIGQKNSKGGYCSHKAPARASDLAIHHPLLVEHRSIGRFKVYRMRIENIEKIIKFLGYDHE